MPGRVTMVTLLCAAAATGVAATVFPALASSDDAWAAFRADVEAACLKAAETMFQSPAAIVDPFGSESFGLALIKGRAKGADTEIRAICVYDKKTKAVEIGGELPAE